MRLIDSLRELSEEDYGPFLQVIDLFDDNIIKVSCGYGPESHNDSKFYKIVGELSILPQKFGNYYVDPSMDQSEELTKFLGVRIEV